MIRYCLCAVASLFVALIAASGPAAEPRLLVAEDSTAVESSPSATRPWCPFVYVCNGTVYTNSQVCSTACGRPCVAEEFDNGHCRLH